MVSRKCLEGCKCLRHLNGAKPGQGKGSHHTDETKAKLSEISKARWRDKEIREKTLISMRSPEARAHWSKHWSDYYADKVNREMARFYGARASGRHVTSLEIKLRKLLSSFPDVEFERPFGPYRVDAYLPEHHLAIEADGRYWHERRGLEYDEKRDLHLLEAYGLIVVRLSELDLEAV